MAYTYEEVFEAYIKLKTYIYYDSTNLYMRKQLAIFETNLADELNVINRINEHNYFRKKYKVQEDEEYNELELYQKKLKIFTAALNSFHENPEYFVRYLNRIEVRFLPKKIEDLKKNSKIISNKRTADKYTIERSTAFIDAPIEIHLISVL